MISLPLLPSHPLYSSALKTSITEAQGENWKVEKAWGGVMGRCKTSNNRVWKHSTPPSRATILRHGFRLSLPYHPLATSSPSFPKWRLARATRSHVENNFGLFCYTDQTAQEDNWAPGSTKWPIGLVFLRVFFSESNEERVAATNNKTGKTNRLLWIAWTSRSLSIPWHHLTSLDPRYEVCILKTFKSLLIFFF